MVLTADPVTAEDFVYAFTRAVETPALCFTIRMVHEIHPLLTPLRFIASEAKHSSLGELKALDAYYFQVTLERPVPYFVKMTSHQTMFPVRKKWCKKWAMIRTNQKTIGV